MGSQHTITERSLISAAQVFNKALHSSGLLTDWQLESYAIDYQKLMKNPKHQTTVTIYFRLPPDVALERARYRATEEGRTFESKLDLPYLEMLHEAYEKLFVKEQDDLIIIDATKSTGDILCDVLAKL